jgi:hypothetical protein
MAKAKEPFNPFYACLVVLGVAFTVTACAYAVMAYRATHLSNNSSVESSVLPTEESRLMTLLDKHGMAIMGAEVLLLGIATVGAIGLDQYRLSRAETEPPKGEKYKQ